MDVHNIRLTSAEISALWTTYIECSATNCFFKHFLIHLHDKEISPILKEAISFNDKSLSKITKIFSEENFPIPQAFSDKDINLDAPALYTDLFTLSFVYRAGQMRIGNYATILGKMARLDIYQFFEDCLHTTTKLYEKSLKLMLSKGIYDRPPYIVYPKSAEFVQHQPSLLNTWIGEGRPLDVLELSELFFAIERNSIGLVLLIGLLQVTKDKEVKDYLMKGKKLSEKQIDTFNKVLKDNESLPIFPVTMEVTGSTISPFSKKLIMFFISSTTQIGLSTLCYAMSVSMRKDLGVQYSLFLAEIMKYGSEGLNIMIQRGWMEQPPQSTDRKNLYK